MATVINSLKRKSSDSDQSENIAPSNTSKIVSDETVELKKTKIKLPSESSSIPKFSGTSKSSILKYSSTVRSMNKPAVQNQITTSPFKNDSSKTPKKLNSNTIINTEASGRKLNRKAIDLAQMEKITAYFQSMITIKDDKVAPIINNIKNINKIRNGANEKVKKYETVVKELKDSLLGLMNELKSVQDACVKHETLLCDNLTDYKHQVEEFSSNIATLKANETRHKKDLLKMTTDLSQATSAITNLEKDCENLKIQINELEKSKYDLLEKLRNEEFQRQTAEVIKAQLEKEVHDSKAANSLTISELKEELNQRIEQSISGYKNEIESLKEQLSKRQNDSERFVNDKFDVEKKNLELREENLRLQSLLRESENSINRYEKDIEKMTSEVKNFQEQVSNKESDLRTTLGSLTELQRQASDEKAILRSENIAIAAKLKTIEEEKSSISLELAGKREEISSALRDIQVLRDTINILETKLIVQEQENALAKELSIQLELQKEIVARCELREENERRERTAANAQLIAIQSETNTRIREIETESKSRIQELQLIVNTLTQERDAAILSASQNGEKVVGLEIEVSQLKHSLESASANHESLEELSRVSGELEILRRRIRETQELKEIQASITFSKIQELEEEVRQGELQRRKLHNIIQELRGNIRVFARVRPFLPSDGIDMSKLPDPSISVLPDGISLRIAKKVDNDKTDMLSFGYDKVFGPSCSQETIFQEVSEFVQSALDGYSVCLFSYGQTGSGKTHTMSGSGNGSMRGIIPRAMEQVGRYKIELESKGWSYSMQISFIEIYNESIRDLLRHNPTDDAKHEIKKDAAGATYVSDVEMITIDPNDVVKIEEIMELAARHRSVGQTAMNERSSRSHSVFTLHLSAINESQGANLKGTLSLVDLAGSERIDRSGVSGASLKESVAINKSLSSLVDVFTAIANKQSHIPFRNSKLTYLLQPALSGDGKTLMLANVSPTEESVSESLCTLRLASQVNQCELGKPKRQFGNAPVSSSSASTSNVGVTKSSVATATSSTASRKPSFIKK